MARAIVFYDGGCGLCHRAVLFALHRDPEGEHFVFAPLHGETYENTLDAETRASLPDSLVLVDPDGAAPRVRSDAVVAIARRIGGAWRVLGHLLAVVPRPIRDAGYDFVARVRHRLFSPPDDTCPACSVEFRDRFLS